MTAYARQRLPSAEVEICGWRSKDIPDLALKRAVVEVQGTSVGLLLENLARSWRRI